MKFLVVGGCGYLGTHLVNELIKRKLEIVVFDDLSGSIKSKFSQPVLSLRGSILNYRDLLGLSNLGPFDGVFHLAAKKSVSESMANPNLYWGVNFKGTRNLLEFCLEENIPNFVFTSSAAVYGASTGEKTDEFQPINPLNTYGETKAAAESMLISSSNESPISTISLRTFNLGGASQPQFFDKSAENVLPVIMRCLLQEKIFKIYGNNFETRDGTCIRDYINVADVVKAHWLAMEFLLKTRVGFNTVVNVASGTGTSVLELVQYTQMLSGLKLNWKFEIARDGDMGVSVGDNSRAKSLLRWSPTIDIHQIVKETIKAYEIMV